MRDFLTAKSNTPESYVLTPSATNAEVFFTQTFAHVALAWASGTLTSWEPFEGITLVPQSGIPMGVNVLSSFEVLPDLDALAEAQGVSPIEDIDELVADFWPQDESLDDLMTTVRRWRDEGDDRHN